MRILVILIFSLMVFALQSFAQKNDYSKLNEKNCGVDVFYDTQDSYGQKKMREAYEKQLEPRLRQLYSGVPKEIRYGMSEDEFVKACLSGHYNKKKKG
jgi:hypothetical protein